MLRSGYAPDNLLPISYAGDPLIRGVEGRETVMTMSDVEQGAGNETVAQGVEFLKGAFAAASGGSPVEQPEQAPDDGIHCDTLSTTDFVLHPLDSVNCLLNRTLFGLLGLVIVTLGVAAFLFTKD